MPPVHRRLLAILWLTNPSVFFLVVILHMHRILNSLLGAVLPAAPSSRPSACRRIVSLLEPMRVISVVLPHLHAFLMRSPGH